ncbi:Coiled-coil and C2 domain-containing protein, partial [Schistosoma japonicum]
MEGLKNDCKARVWILNLNNGKKPLDSAKSLNFFVGLNSTDLPEIEEAQFDITQPSTDEIIGLKPPVIKKRKKVLRKPPSDMAAEDVESVPSVEIKQSSTDHDHYKKIKKEDKKDKVIQKEELPISNLPPSSRMMKYGRSSKQYTKSRSSYLLPERMQRLRRDGGLGDVSTSSELSFNEWKVKETINQITQDEFFTKEWNDNVIKQKNSIYDYFSTIGSPSLPFINNEQLTVVDELQPKSVKSKRYRSHSKRIGSNIDEHLTELPHENQPLLGFVERTQYDLLMFGRSTYLTNQERIKYESKFLYNPPDTEAPTNLRRLENRIIKEIQMDVNGLKSLRDLQSADMELFNGTIQQDQELENKKLSRIQSWFREDGLLDLQPNPLRNIPSRPSLWDDQFNPKPEKLQVFYVYPLSHEMTLHYLNSKSRSLQLQSHPTTLSCKQNSWLHNNDSIPECRLQVDIRRITFDFHSLFSLEHVHAQNLRQIIQVYELTLSRDQVNACIQRINALKRALEQLEEKRMNKENILNQNELLDIDRRIEDYYHEINLMRRARNHAEAYEKGLLTSALRAWKRVKEARESSGCINTTIRLKITKQITNVEQDQEDWNKELNEIVDEAKHEFDKQFKEELKKYEEEMAIYKKEKKQQDAALRRQRLRESGQTDGDWEDSAELEREDAQILAKKTLNTPPIRPKPFNAQMIKDEIEANLKKTRRLPNEPKITVSLVNDTVLSTIMNVPVIMFGLNLGVSVDCPVYCTLDKNELNRRLKLLEYTYFIKLYYNNKLVETSQPILLTHNFTLDFHWILPILIRYQPESIVAKLYEKHGWDSYQIAKFHITLPNYTDIQMSTVNQTNLNSELDLQHLRFTVTTGPSFKLNQSKLNQKQTALSLSSSSPSSSSYVGSQPKILLEDLDGSGEKMVCLPITGTLFASAKWISINPSLIDTLDIEACDGYPNRNSLKPHGFDLQSLIHPTPSYLQSTQLFQSNPLFLNDTNKSEDEQRYTTSVLDPNNTTDAKLLNLIQTATGKHLLPKQLHTASCPEVLYHTRASGVNYFHLNFLIECYNFCTDEDLDKSKRLRLIQLREKGIPEFQNIIIPPLGKHIPEEIFDSVDKKKDPDYHHGVLLKGMKAYKRRHEIYIEKIKSEVSQHFQDALKKKSVREIVIEEEIPNILFLLPFFKRLFEPKRPLRPSYQERRRIGPQYVQDSCLSLIVTLHGAYNLPNRCTRQRGQSNRRDKAENRNETLKPFAEIKFQQNKRSTITSEGRNPSWNTEFRFTFFLPPDKPKLECMKDPIIINVYDQVTFMQTDSTQNDSSHYIQRIENRLIGSTEIPLSTVYLNTKISGKINLSIPLILHGYETLNLAKSSIRPMIDVLMTLEPSIFPPEPLIDTFISVESIEIQTSLSKWYQKLSKHKSMTNRLFKPLVMNSDCHEVLMTRFLTSLNPPEEFLPGTESRLTISESMLCVARYVSLIPYESDVASFPGMAQVWCTCDQFLSMLCGDKEEHAVLLACYFMYILKYNSMDNTNDDTLTDEQSVKKSSNSSMNSVYLCIGEAIPE